MKSDGIPFKVYLNGNPCVIVVCNDHVSAEFSGLQEPLHIMYDEIRCIQQWNDNVLINVQKDRLYSIIITQKNAKKIYTEIISMIRTRQDQSLP